MGRKIEMNVDKVLSEVYSVILALGVYYKSRIDFDVMEAIENGRDINYFPKIDINKPLQNQALSTDAINIILKLHIDFWCDTYKEKENLLNILKENEEKLLEKFPIDIFKK